ncbi:MAG: OsmC family protein [Promethearchaeota archaeon]
MEETSRNWIALHVQLIIYPSLTIFMLITDESRKAYHKRILSMKEHGFTARGDELYKSTMIAESSQVDNLRVKTKINEFIIESDEPESLGGTNEAPRPMELLLAALANCLEISALLYFSFANLKVTSVRVQVEAEQDIRFVLNNDEAPAPGFNNIKITWFVKSSESGSKIKRILDKISNNCPVKGTLDQVHSFPSKVIIE